MPRAYTRKAPVEAATAVITPAPEYVAPVSPRQVEEKAQRRRRNNGDLNTMTVMRLGLPPEVMRDNADFDLRWVNDEGGRIQHLTQQDDYDVVEGVEGRQVGTTTEGRPIVARLLRKPKEFAEEDRRAKLDVLNSQEKNALKGEGSGATASSSAGIYAPSDNIIKGFKP